MSAATHLAKKDKSKVGDEAAVAALEAAKQDKAKKKTEDSKKKSNLELFKEELKRNQLDREERHKKRQLEAATNQELDKALAEASNLKAAESGDLSLEHDVHSSQQDSTNLNSSMSKHQQPVSDQDPNTTNIFISNLSPKVFDLETVISSYFFFIFSNKNLPHF